MHPAKILDLHIVKLDISADQFKIFKKIYKNFNTVFILESLVGPRELSEISIIGFDPSFKVIFGDEYVRVKKDDKVMQYESRDPLLTIKTILPRVNNQNFRYVGGAVGYVSYETINSWESLRTRNDKPRFLADYFPAVEFGIYTDGILIDHSRTNVYYFYQGKASRLDLLLAGLREAGEDENMKDRFYHTRPTSNLSRKQYIDMVKRSKDYIYKGDVFQVVLSRNLHFNIEGDALFVYERLRRINPSPYMYFLKTDGRQIIGSSPEMLLRVTRNYLETYPIAGTRPVVSDPDLNKRLRRDLVNDKKEKSEHTMLVDLARNDVGRVCNYGSVSVEGLMAVRRFSHVQHMVTHVSGSLRRKFDQFDAFKALFPAGTVSGAPKVRAMEIIDELEPCKRGPYAGALGYFSSNGSCDFAIIIRSLFIQGRKAYSQAGAGIVIDSDPQKEWRETGHKLDAVLLALRGSRTY